MRLFFLLLAFANLVFFAWAQGYFGLPDDGHEPQRLTQQLHPDKLRIAPLTQAPAAKPDVVACRLVSGLSTANAAALGAAMEAAGAKAKVSPVPLPDLHVVIIGDLASKALADRKFSELTRLGLEGHRILALGGDSHEIRLGEFPTDAAAREYLLGIARRGIKSARIETRGQTPLKAQVEVRGPDSALQQHLPPLIAPHADASLGECAS